MLRRITLVSALVAALPLLGCQVISASITSPSDWVSGTGESISGSFRSLSRSSGSGGGDAAKTAYRRDVRAFAVQFARTGGSSDDFLRGVGRVAEDHGVADWESDAATPFAIGAGLADAGVSEAELAALTGRSDGDREVVALVREGYAAAR